MVRSGVLFCCFPKFLTYVRQDKDEFTVNDKRNDHTVERKRVESTDEQVQTEEL